jgi:multiple sugar transport system substrate-binding protein
VAVVITGPLAATAACGSGSGGGATGGKVELRFTWWGSDSRHAYTQKLIALYQSRHPNITIKPEYSNFNDYWNKLATSVAGGNAPDVMQQEFRYVREYADRGALADLTPYLGSTIADADFDPSVKDAGKVGGKTYAIATGVNAFTIVANPALFERAHVPLPDDKTWTWDQLRQTASAITAASPKGTYGLQEPGYVDAGLEIFARQHGSGLYNAFGKLAVTKDVLTQWFTFIQSLSPAKATPAPSVSVEVQAGGVDQSLMATGKGAMGGWWTNELPALTKASGVQLKLLRLPGDATTPGTFFKPSMFWSVGAKTKHPKEAAEFVNFLLNDPDAAKLILVDRGMPINLKLRLAIIDALAPADRQSALFLDTIRATIGAPAVLPPKGAGKIQTILQKTNEQVMFTRMTPAQAADDFLSQANAAIG